MTESFSQTIYSTKCCYLLGQGQGPAHSQPRKEANLVLVAIVKISGMGVLDGFMYFVGFHFIDAEAKKTYRSSLGARPSNILVIILHYLDDLSIVHWNIDEYCTKANMEHTDRTHW